ncbi:MAG: hypothetical protein IPK23_15010 [Rhizobiales bacterium]|nr:hypothetical protein [Hyphomicrobiales bacterium]
MSKLPEATRARHKRNLQKQRQINAALRAAAASNADLAQPFIQADGKLREPYVPDARPAAIVGTDLLLARLQAGRR